MQYLISTRSPGTHYVYMCMYKQYTHIHNVGDIEKYCSHTLTVHLMEPRDGQYGIAVIICFHSPLLLKNTTDHMAWNIIFDLF